jgi:hypothetical protein
MTTSPQRFPYKALVSASRTQSLMPVLPLAIAHLATVQIEGLVDSGSSMNWIPHSVGLQLGFMRSCQGVAVLLEAFEVRRRQP